MNGLPGGPSFVEFLQRLEAESREAGFRVLAVGQAALAFEFRGVKGEFFYENLWREFASAPAGDRADLVKWHVRQRALSLQALSPDSYAAAKARLLPRVVSWDWGRGTPAETTVPLWPLVEGHLQISLVIDAPQAVRYITAEEIKQWKTPFQELYRVAEENLKARTDIRRVERFPGNVQVRYYQSMDGHDAARALVLKHLMDPFPRAGLVFVVPARDFLAFTPIRGGESLEIVHTLLERAQPVYATEAGPICVNAFWFDGEAFEVITADYTPRGRGLVYSERFFAALSAAPEPSVLRR